MYVLNAVADERYRTSLVIQSPDQASALLSGDGCIVIS